MSFPDQTEGLDTPPTSRLENNNNNNNNNNNKYTEAIIFIIFIIFIIILFMFFHKLWTLSVVKKTVQLQKWAKFFCHETNWAIVLVM